MTTDLLLPALPPLSLYIHIPWCVRKCPYCDFNSHTTDKIPEQAYIAALIEDLEQELASVQGRPLVSIFFGGGTPSLFSAQAINSLLEAVAKRIHFSPDIEITLEANPGTFEQEKFSAFHRAGINRLSLGVQSFQQHHLIALGRIHSNQEAVLAAEAARMAGFNNCNIDLMHGLPGQSSTEALQDLQRAVDLSASHISWYQLTIEPNTAFYNAPPLLPSDDQLADIQDAGEQLLASHNYQQYEISAYSKPSRRSRHNLNYWLFGDYIGIGAGAHGKLSTRLSVSRRWKTRAPKDYLEPTKNYLAGSKQITCEQMPIEFMMNSLRLNEGFSPQLFQQRTGCPIGSISSTLNRLVASELLVFNDQLIKPTALGRRFLNDILAEF